MLDWLIRGAQVLDGTGADAFPADVVLKDGTIAAVGRLTDADAAHVLDARGRTLTPGFLDGVSGTYHDPEIYFVCERDPRGFEEFEAAFPPKTKRKLPGQLL